MADVLQKCVHLIKQSALRNDLKPSEAKFNVRVFKKTQYLYSQYNAVCNFVTYAKLLCGKCVSKNRLICLGVSVVGGTNRCICILLL